MSTYLTKLIVFFTIFVILIQGRLLGSKEKAIQVDQKSFISIIQFYKDMHEENAKEMLRMLIKSYCAILQGKKIRSPVVVLPSYPDSRIPMFGGGKR